MTAAAEGSGVRIGLSVVIMALREGVACVLTTRDADGVAALPFGPFDPARDRTFERALRDFVTDQTGFPLGFVEQLYTFGDLGRAAPRATPGPDRRREVSVGYLALTPHASAAPSDDAAWTPVLDVFPWEDRREGPSQASSSLSADLEAWAGDEPSRRARIDALFAISADARWNEGQVLERYELLYEAGLVPEAARDHGRPPADPGPGRLMASDHRRILATGLGRLRSKLRYRPVLFDLMPETFTLSQLQSGAEAVSGLALHKQNFRRGVERAGLVEPTGLMSAATGGRPAELFRRLAARSPDADAQGLALPTTR